MSKHPRSTTIHLLLQGKGGIGKTPIAGFLAQYFMSRGQPVRCIDVDPLGNALSRFKGLNAERFPVFRDGDIDVRSFDAVFETVLRDHGTYVIDAGASIFIQLWSYILESDLITTLNDSGRRLYFHYVVTRDQSEGNPLRFFRQLAEGVPSRSIVLWINDFFGRPDERDVEMLDTIGRVFGSVTVPMRNPDIRSLLINQQTFDEALERRETLTFNKQRLKTQRDLLFAQLDRLPWVIQEEKAA